MKSKIAVITRTVIGRETFLKRSIESVLSQTFSDLIHVIVVDGPSTKEVESIVDVKKKKYKGRVIITNTQKPYGKMEAGSNVGINASDSKYVVIHDDDDSWEPDFLEKTVSFLDSNTDIRLKGVVTRSEKIVEKLLGSRIVEESRELFNPWINGISLYRMLGENMFPPISFVYERSVLEDIGLYDEDLPVLGDWDFNIRFLVKYDVGFIPESLAHYHFRYTSDDVVGNTLTAGIGKHFIYDHKIRNKFLRKDITQGQLGIGFMMSNSYANVQIQKKVDELDVRVSAIENKVNSLEYLAHGIRRTLPYRLVKGIKSILSTNKG